MFDGIGNQELANFYPALPGYIRRATQAQIETGTDQGAAVTPGLLKPSNMTWIGRHTWQGKSIDTARAANRGSASSLDIWTTGDGNFIHVTGAVAIVNFAQAPQAGAWRILIFDSTPTIVNSATVLVAGGGNYVAAVNDMALVIANDAASPSVCYVFPLRESGVPLTFPDIGLLALLDNPPSWSVIAGTVFGGVAGNRMFRVGEVGGWSVLAQQVASNTPVLDFNFAGFASDFDDFRFIGSYLAPINDSVHAYMRASGDGVNFDAGASYAWSTEEFTPAGLNSASDPSDTIMRINALDALGNGAHENMCFDMMVYNVQQGGTLSMLTWTFGLQSSIPRLNIGRGAGRWFSANIRGLRFGMVTGNINYGKVTMLGRRNVT